MQDLINFKAIHEGNVECVIDLECIFTNDRLKIFNNRWEEFFTSDEANASIFKRNGNTIKYRHKSWIPLKKDDKPSVIMLFGNPASHSVREDVYFSYERNGSEHRFWRVLRELGYICINANPKTKKQEFLNLEYESPFRLGFEVIYSFPSSASKPKWSGVLGLERLFCKKGLELILESEKIRVLPLLREFTKDGGAIIAMQKDAYNSIAQNSYSLKRAKNFDLHSRFDNSIKIYGTPPTRWLYTTGMKELMRKIKGEILDNYGRSKGRTN